MQVRGELLVGEDLQDRVADQVGHGFDPGAVERDELVAHLLVGQPDGVQGQPGRDVVAGVGPAQGHQVGHGLREDQVALVGVGGVEDLRHAVGDALPDLVRAAEQRAQHAEGDGEGVLGEQVRRAGGAETLDGVGGDLLDEGAQPVLVHLVDGVGVRGPVAGVLGAARAQRVGPPLHHRPHRAGRRDQLLPGPRVGREAQRVVQDAAGLVVADHQGRRDPRRQVHGDERTVGAAHAPVGGVRVGGELRRVQGDPARFTRRRGLGGGQRHRRDSRRAAERCSERYSVSVIRACREEVRSRASQYVSGVAGSRASASRSSASG